MKRSSHREPRYSTIQVKQPFARITVATTGDALAGSQAYEEWRSEQSKSHRQRNRESNIALKAAEQSQYVSIARDQQKEYALDRKERQETSVKLVNILAKIARDQEEESSYDSELAEKLEALTADVRALTDDERALSDSVKALSEDVHVLTENVKAMNDNEKRVEEKLDRLILMFTSKK